MVEADLDGEIEFKWGKKKGLGGKKKDVQFYESFTYDGVEYSLYDSVYMFNENEPEPYIGILIEIWENPDKAKKVKLLWFFHPCEISNYIGTEQFQENELLLASGKGEGLTNVNPLEAIVGKCNVACTSKDDRNPKPFDKELQMANFTFHRIFDVGRCLILDKFDEKVAGLDVKVLFNRMHNQECSVTPKLDSDRKSVEGNAIGIDEINNKVVCDNAMTTTIFSKNSSLEKKMDENNLILDEVRKLDRNDENSGQRITTMTLASEKSLSLRQEITLKVGGDGAKNNGLVKIHNNTLVSNYKKDTLHYTNSQVGEVLVNQSRSKGKGKTHDDVGTSKQARLHGYDNVLGNKRSMLEVHCDVKGDTKAVHRASKDERDDKKIVEDEKNKRTEESSLNKAHDVEVEIKASVRERDSLALDGGSLKKAKLEEKPTKLANDKLFKPSPKQSLNMGSEPRNDSRRSEVDKSKWFKLPLDKRLQFEHEQGRLVLLQNLDPTYCSSEVEEIIQKTFNQSCLAKMIQCTAFSSSHIGQAFVIFRSRQAVEMVVKQLDEGCFLLPSGRPLVSSITAPRFPAKQSTFCGHLAFEKQRHHMQREMKEAISNSHCSQPNTIEYDMAMEWCVLQEKSDQEWKVLHKQQGNELRNLKAELRNFKAMSKAQ